MHPVFIHFLKGGGIGVAEYLKHSIREGFSLGAVQLTDPVLDGAVQNDALRSNASSRTKSGPSTSQE